MTRQSQIVRTRFAPSPTGHLHVGGARTALFCWAYAKGRGGKFVLRIEDTDVRRSSEVASFGLLRELKWLGLEWDEGPKYVAADGSRCGSFHDDVDYYQSRRLDLYGQYLDQLVQSGLAYYAFDTPAELDARRAEARKAGRNYRYDRAALKLSAQEVERFLAEERPAVIRLRIPDEPVTIRDEVLGEATIPPEQLDDFIIRKADGYPTYHFAVVVDDELMGVTHVIRAQEHFNNTAKHMLLQDALGFRRPVYAHLPLIVNPDGSKMSKREKDKTLRAAVKERGLTEPPQAEHGLPAREHGLPTREHGLPARAKRDDPLARAGSPCSGERVIDPAEYAAWLKDKDRQLDFDAANALAVYLDVHLPEISVDDFRRSGYLPEVMVNYLALLGWNPGGDVEKFDLDFLTARFDFDRVMRSPAKFDRAKLLAFNLDALQAMEPDEFARRFRTHCEEYRPEFVDRLTPGQFDLLARANQKRAKTLDDVIPGCRFFIADDEEIEYEDSKPVRKALTGGSPTGLEHLAALLPILERVEPWDVENPAAAVEGLERAVKAYADAHAEGKVGAVAQPLRIAVSGTTVSPAIFETLAILGRKRVVARIRRCLAQY